MIANPVTVESAYSDIDSWAQDNCASMTILSIVLFVCDVQRPLKTKLGMMIALHLESV